MYSPCHILYTSAVITRRAKCKRAERPKRAFILINWHAYMCAHLAMFWCMDFVLGTNWEVLSVHCTHFEFFSVFMFFNVDCAKRFQHNKKIYDLDRSFKNERQSIFDIRTIEKGRSSSTAAAVATTTTGAAYYLACSATKQQRNWK